MVGFLLVAGILLVSAVLTQLFGRAMYHRCQSCGVLNAKRRTNCRVCHQEVPQADLTA